MCCSFQSKCGRLHPEKVLSDVAGAMRTMDDQVFTYLEKPTMTYVKDENGKETNLKPDESDFFV